MQPQIILADLHSMTRKGLRSILELTLGQKDISEANSYNDLLEKLHQKKYTHLLLGNLVADGSILDLLPRIRAAGNDLHILIFSMHIYEALDHALKKEGIYHNLPKTTPEPETISILQRYFNDDRPSRSSLDGEDNPNPFLHLSPREMEIMRFLIEGSGTKTISEALNIKMTTVSTIKSRIYEKTGAGSVKELIELATLYNLNY